MTDINSQQDQMAPKTNPTDADIEAKWRASLEPQRPHDALTFDELARRYNFQKTSDRRIVLVRMIIAELEGRPGPTRVLDIGAGNGIGRKIVFQQAIASHCDDLWGIEPDEGIVRTDGVFTRYLHTMMETAELPENSFDVAYAFMVMEHVTDPAGFLVALKRCLKPGGVFFFMTPNRKHYFTQSANLLRALKLDEFTLRIIHRQDKLDEYHYPVMYRFNTPRQIDLAARNAGMDHPGYVYLESDGPRPYMRGPLKPIFHLLKLKRSIFKNPRALLTLTGRIAKPSANEVKGAVT